jgi:hypothetical protein
MAPSAYNTRKLSCEFIGKKPDKHYIIAQGKPQVNHRQWFTERGWGVQTPLPPAEIPKL